MKNKINYIIILILLISTSLLANSQNFKPDSINAIKARNEALRLYKESKYIDAINFLNKSLNFNKKLYGEKSFEAARILNVLGATYRNIGNYDEALNNFLEAEELYLNDTKTNQVSIANLYNNIGNTYKNIFDFTTALSYYERAANIYLNHEQINKSRIADIFYNIANTNYELRNYTKTIELIEKYLPYSQNVTKLYFLSLKSIALRQLNRNKEAYLTYKEAIEFAKNYYSENDINVAFEYLNFARFLISANQFDEAKEVLIKAKNIFDRNNIKDGINLALYFKALGIYNENIVVESKNIEVFRKEKVKNLKNAIENYHNGLKTLNYDVNKLSINFDAAQTISLTQTLDFLKLIADTYTQIASVYEDSEKANYKQSLLKAIDFYKVTSNIIQNTRKEIYSEDSKIQLNELEQATFYKVIETAYKTHEIDNEADMIEFAFNNAERIKSSSVFDRLTDEIAKEKSLIPDSLSELEKNLNYRITTNSEKLFNLNNADKTDQQEINRTDSLLFELKKQRENLNQYLVKNYQDYYNLKYSDASVTIPEIQQKLNNNEVLIEYVLNENDSIPELYSFFISKNNSKFIKQEVDTGFISSIEETFRFMSNQNFLFTKNEDSKQFCVSANHLYKKLIAPFSNEIKDKKLIVIPDGKLSYIAFEGLLEEMPDTSSQIRFTHLPYLIRKNTINYAYSANLLFNTSDLQKKAKKQVLAFAPEYKKDTVVFENDKIALTPLPGVQREVDLISDEIKTKLFRNNDATEENFRKNSNDYSILHLAMHAFINDSLPAFSRLAFAQNSRNEADNDGWLNTADIYNLDFNARLTVLSACNTGSGKLKKGEGVMSLARGFLYAGCPTIIMTQWEVEDNAGTKIMSSFYKNLKKGRSIDESLRMAKLEYLENANPRMAHPHYWLGYISIGDAKPMFRSYDYYFFGLLLLVMLGIGIDQIVRIRKSTRRKKE